MEKLYRSFGVILESVPENKFIFAENARLQEKKSGYTVNSCISFATVVISAISPTREPQKIRP